jgi:putative endonuclease
MAQKIELGKSGEALIAEYLMQKGYFIIDRNWRIKGGEIDLIASSPEGVIVFVEVKTRSSESFGHPLEAINSEKQARLMRLALAWLLANKKWSNPYRIDCAAVIMRDPPKIDYRAGVI